MKFPYLFLQYSSGGNASASDSADFSVRMTGANYTDGAGEGYLQLFTRGQSTVNGSTTYMKIGQWYHICVVKNNADSTMKGYVNGNLEVTLNNPHKPVSDRPTVVGGLHSTSGLYSVQGYYSNVRIQYTALSASQVTTNAINYEPLLSEQINISEQI